MKNNFIIYLSVTFITSLLAFIINPILSHHVSTNEFGSLGLFLAFTQFFAVVVGWSSNSIIVKCFYTRKDINVLIGSSITISLCLVTLLFVLLSFTSEKWLAMTGLSVKLLFLALLSSLFLIISAMFQSVFQMSSNAKYWSVVTLTGAVIAFLMTVSAITYGNFIFEFRLLSMVVANVTSVLVGFYLLRRLLSISFALPKEHIKLYFYTGTPLLVAALASWGQTFIDRLMVTNLLRLEDVGIYVFAVMLTSPLLIMFTTYTRVWSPNAYLLLSENKKYLFLMSMWRSFLGYSVLTLLFSFIGPYVFKYFIDEEYYYALILIPILSANILFIGFTGLLNPIILHFNKLSFLAFISIVGVFLSAIFCYLLIPILSIKGAAFSVLLSSIIVSFFSLCVAWAALKA